MRMRGSARPAEIIIAAGLISPKYFRRIGQQSRNSAAFGSTYVTRTTSRRLAPASASADSIFRRHWSVCSMRLSEIVIDL